MKGAKYFIEQYCHPLDKELNNYTPCMDISSLKKTLGETKVLGLQTIAIWYIKPKKFTL